jgi:hypothetical protein
VTLAGGNREPPALHLQREPRPIPRQSGVFAGIG